MRMLKMLGLGARDSDGPPMLPLALETALQVTRWTSALQAYPDQPHVNEHRGRDPIRTMERVSIYAYVERWRHLLQGRVLDFGAGTQPYRHLADPRAEYEPFDPGMAGESEAAVPLPAPFFDTVMCNQVMQYVVNPARTIARLSDVLRPGGHLLLTYATNWPEVEPWDLHRHTKAGMEKLLTDAGFLIIDHTRRCEIRVGGFCVPLGYGVIAQKQHA